MEKNNRYAGSFRDLEVYKLSRELSGQIFRITTTFPKEERYALTDQIRRFSRSIGAQIAEAWGKRRYENHFILKLTDCDSEQYETQHWIDESCECGYIDEPVKSDLVRKCEMIGKMLNSMIDKSSMFCQHRM